MDEIKGKIKFSTNFFQAPNKIFGKTIVAPKEIKRNKKVIETINIQRNINGNEIAVYLYLCRMANNNECTFPSYNTIAKNCGISRRTSIKCIEILFNNNLIIKKTRLNPYSDELRNFSNVYEILEP